MLPNYSILHKQDIFITEKYEPDIRRDELSFLSRSFERHFNERPYLHHACYLFLEEGKAYQGVRLYLTFLDESTDQERIRAMSRRPKRPDEGEQERKFLVRFRVDKALNLLGGERKELE